MSRGQGRFMAVELERRHFTVEEYHRMAGAGILTEDDRVELIDGEILTMTPIGWRHAACVATLIHLFSPLSRDRAVLWPQNPIGLGPRSEPQPDVTLLRPRRDMYRHAGPRSEDVLLLVEVADTSIAYDRGVKLSLYAAAGIPEVWLVDLEGRAVEVHRAPTPPGVRETQRLLPGEPVSPAAFPDVVLAVAEILGVA